jgi:2-(1,2-epoxy-1,2-dihydrophenyl)acetyl-CoA isomerase
MDLAEKLAKAPTRSIGLIKRALNKSLACDLDALLDYEAVIQEIASKTEDYQEGVKAFLEKREAVFKGR